MAGERSQVEQMIDRIIADGKLSTSEKQQLDALVLADGKLSLEERQALDRLITLIARGELLVAD